MTLVSWALANLDPDLDTTLFASATGRQLYVVLGTNTLADVVTSVYQGKPSSVQEEDLRRNGCVVVESPPHPLFLPTVLSTRNGRRHQRITKAYLHLTTQSPTEMTIKKRGDTGYRIAKTFGPGSDATVANLILSS